jgi:hypothetical protein
MTITNETKTRRIDFAKLESVREHYPSHRIQIAIKTENIQTHFDNYIWISSSDIEKFLSELSILDEQRKGQVTLESMSPGELELTVKAIDGLGHLSVTCYYIKEDRIDNDYSYSIKVEFRIDPTSIPAIKRELLELMN